MRHLALRRRRSFFALATNGDLFPCSEFIGAPAFAGGNLFEQPIEEILESPAFRLVSGRKVEDIAGCDLCPIPPFLRVSLSGRAPEMNGGMEQKGAFCAFYEEQVRYALRLIADGTAPGLPVGRLGCRHRGRLRHRAN